ncbi:phosphatase PAP2 family protein [Paenibacillus sp. BSR1-1]|uniref:phosphatase PAP2 family protein n=1 Tax=Paenibacillus sp. BSR1-1 TaxID=3020845 RepID=UPI0025AF021A|nr:phosphatase PAP2 family protein [Paenibacillus sp. BSR1-1]MDN3020073.1 phosphatase PAP2 family protein [Paenibacillus sp. BSR1-1]
MSFFDGKMDGFIRGFHDERLISIAKVISHLGGYRFCLMLTIILALVLVLNRYFLTSFVLFTAFIGTRFLRNLFKDVIERPRPEFSLIKNHGKSFPSGHILYASMFYGLVLGVIWYVLMKNGNKAMAWFVCLLFVIILSLVGASRVYLGAHYSSDILGGIFLGIACLTFTFMVLIKIWKKGWQ